MRILALSAVLATIALTAPCAAQTATAEAEPPRTSIVAKQSPAPEPQRLAPPQETATAAQPQRLAPPNLQPPLALSRPIEPVRAVPAETQRPAPAPQAPETRRSAAPLPAFSTPDSLLEWVYNYRSHKAPSRVPAAVQSMRELGLFRDEEKAAFCTGFIAGVLGDNPKDGPRLVAKMLPMPDKDQAVLIRAIAYSGRPDWRDLLTKFKDRMPLRGPLIDSYTSGEAKTLMQVELDKATVIYTLWGYYVATGQYQPVVRIMQALRWSKNKNDGNFSVKKIFSGWRNDPSAVDKISTGATAKWTLASYAERNRDLLSLYRAEYERQPPEIAKPLRDVIVAAEAFESEKVRKDQFGAIEDAQKLQATNEAGMSKAATAGSIAIATGCVAASALGQFYIAVPCVIGGALYTGAMKLMH
jgi:hypothetical protein